MAPRFAHPFVLQIQHVEFDEGDPTAPSPVGAPDFLWRPKPSARFTVRRSSGWWVWDPGLNQPQGQLQRLRKLTSEEAPRCRSYKTCTMIWAPERQAYIHIPIDRTTTEESSVPYSWRRLRFGRHEHPARAHIALVGHQRDGEWLHLPGPEHWFQELLPNAYQCQTTETQQCRLAGDLSILVGLVAFSAPPEHDIVALDRSFRRDPGSTRFRPNGLSTGPTPHRRAMVIEIGYDSSKVSAEQLAAWEEGRHGEIFS